MEFIYKRAHPDIPGGPFLDTTEIVFPKIEDVTPEDIEVDNNLRIQLELLLPKYSKELPVDEEQFPERIILIGIVHRRVIHRLLRDEPLVMPSPELQGPIIEDVPL
ncbi:hypothetical protein A3D14_00475 [Candidatus Saccharibacteria bacterium RIFCSPHIGHO2_02_FULL_47_12]|nr:MAG: hypothetical protein A3D14_00475 [Candidatus Saccharibacteria bacterium RIFCSPHIGHO2_02_FULL_47_12]